MPAFGAKRIVFDAKKIFFDIKRIFPDTKRIVFNTKRIGLNPKRIFFDKKKMKTEAGIVFPAIETVASTIETLVFLVDITICGTKTYSQKRNPFSAHLRSSSLLRGRPAAFVQSR